MQRASGTGSYQPDRKRISMTVKFYADPDGLISSTVGGEKRGTFHISTLMPVSQSALQWEFHQDEFDTIIENGAVKAVRGVITKLFDKSQGNYSSGAGSSE